MAQEIGLDLTEAHKQCLEQLNELDEACLFALQHTTFIQKQRASWHNNISRINPSIKVIGHFSMILRFQYFLGKLQTRWLGPYEIYEDHDNGTVTLINIDGSGSPFLVNGHRLRVCHQPLSKESFCQEVSKDPTTQILTGWEGNPTSSTS